MSKFAVRHRVSRKTVTFAMLSAAAVYFGWQLFIMHEELSGHGFDLTAVLCMERVLSFVCGE